MDVAVGDLRLFAGSPLIDAGDPAAPEAGDSATDAGGSPRIANGRRDIGAFEGAVAVPAGAGPVAPPPGSSALDLTAPELASAKLSRTVFRVGATSTALTSARRRTPGRGTVVTYTLSEVAVVTFTVERRLGGRFVTRKGSSRQIGRAHV